MARVDARDVLDANAQTVCSFEGEIIGYYRPTGPNSWDDYEYVSEEQGPIHVYGGLKVQLEPHGAVFRMRSKGRVVRVRWVPSADEQRRSGDSPRAARARFLAECVSAFSEEPGRGASAVIASKLDE